MRYLRIAAVALAALTVASGATAQEVPAPAPELSPADQAAKDLHEAAVATVKNSSDHEGNVRTLRKAAGKLVGTSFAGKLDALLASETGAAKAQADETAAALARLMAGGKVYKDLKAAVKESDDHAANVARIRAAMPKLRGTAYMEGALLLLAQEKEKLSRMKATASSREKAAREGYYNDLTAKLRTTSDPAARLTLLVAGIRRLEGTPYERALERKASTERKALAAAKASASEAAAERAYSAVRAKVQGSSDHEANLKALIEAEPGLKGTRYEFRLAPMIAAEKRAIERAATQTAADAKARAEAEARAKAEADRRAAADAKTKAEAERRAAADAKARAEAEARAKAEADRRAAADAKAKAEEDARAKAEAERKAQDDLYAGLREKVRTSDDHAANLKALIEAEPRLKGSRYERYLAPMISVEKRAIERAQTQAAADAKARTEAEARAKAEADRRAAADAKTRAEEEARSKAEAERKAQDDLYAGLREKVRTSDDHAANLKALIEAEPRLKGSRHESRLAPMISVEKRAIERAQAQAAADAKAKAAADAKAKAGAERKAQDDLYNGLRKKVRASSDHEANLKALLEALPKLKGGPYESRIDPMISAEKREIELAKAKAAYDAKARAAADAKARVEAERKATDDLYNGLRETVRTSKNHEANLRVLMEAVPKLKGTKYEGRLEPMIETEKKGIAADQAGRKEKAAEKVYNDARAKVKASIIHADNIKLLEAAAPKLRGTRYEGRLDPLVAAEKKAKADAELRAASNTFNGLKRKVASSRDRSANITAIARALQKLQGTRYEDQLLRMAETEKGLLEKERAAAADAAALKVYQEARTAIRRSRDYAANVRLLEEAAGRLKGTRHEGKLDSMIAAEKKKAGQ